MTTLQELYREFEINRVLHLAPGEGATKPVTEVTPSVEAPKELKTTEDIEKAKEPINDKIKKQEEGVKGKIDSMVREYEKSEDKTYLEAAQKFGKQMKDQATSEFSKLRQEYIQKREAIGKAVAEQNPEKFKEIFNRAENLKNTIMSRVSGKQAEQEIEHVRYQDKLAKATEGLPSETREDLKRIEEAEKDVKSEIISDYLQDTYGIKDKVMANALGRFIIEEKPDFGLKYDVSKKTPEEVDRSIKNQLREIDLQKVVDRFLKEAPSPEATVPEKRLFAKMVKGNPKLADYFGKSAAEDSYLDKVVTALAKRFDVRFGEDGKPIYAIDLTDYKVVPFTEGIQTEKGTEKLPFKQIFESAIADYRLQDPNRVDKYTDDIDNKNNDLKVWRQEIDKGNWRALGGEITEIRDFQDHEAATKLLAKSEGVREQATKIEDAQREHAQTEKKEAVDNAKLAKFRGVQTKAGLTEANLKKLSTVGYEYDSKNDTEDIPNGKETIVLTKEGLPTITITLDKALTDNPNIVVKIEDAKNKVSDEITYTPANKFAKDIADPKKIEEMALAPAENIKANKEKKTAIDKKITDINKELDKFGKQYNKKNKDKSGEVLHFDISKNNFNDQQYSERNLQYTATLKLGDKFIGDATIDFANTDASKIDTAIIKDPNNRPLELGKVIDEIKEKYEFRKEQANRIEENRKTLQEKWDKEKGTLAVSDLAFNNEEKLTIRSDDPADEVLVSKVETKDKKEIAKIYLAEGRYVLKSSSNTLTNQTFEKPEDVNKYLADNKNTLIAETEKGKPDELANRVEVKEIPPNIRPALENFLDMLDKEIKMPMVPDMPPITIEMLTREAPWLLNVLIDYVKSLPPDRLNQLSNKETSKNFRITPEEDKKWAGEIVKAFELQFGKIEKVDNAEVAIINNLDVKIGDQTKKFNEVFGDDLAKTLSMRYEIQEVNGKTDVIRIRKNGQSGDEGWTEVNVKDLGPYASIYKGGQESYSNIINGKADTKAIDLAKKGFSADRMSLEGLGQIKDIVEQYAQNPEIAKKMGFFELLAALGELLKAMQAKDFETFGEIIKDIKEGKPSAEVIENSMNKMREKLSTVDDLNTLLDIHKNPKGSVAEATFGKGMRYRMKAKEVIQGKFEKALGLTSITEMTEVEGGSVTRITGYRGSKQYMFDIERVPGMPTKATMSEFKKPEGKEEADWIPGEPVEVKGLEKGNDSLAAKVGLTGAPANTGEKPPAKPEDKAAEGDKSKETPKIAEGSIKDKSLVGENNVVTETGGKKTIHDILDTTKVTEATIKIGEAKRSKKQEIPSGTEVKVIPGKENGKDTFVIADGENKGKRLRVYAGDQILETKAKTV